ncbi:hypothetical protein [Bacillus sp. FJAT-27245]|nr:hypothetical protein [Bacillus sp. FJAT-27245]
MKFIRMVNKEFGLGINDNWNPGMFFSVFGPAANATGLSTFIFN